MAFIVADNSFSSVKISSMKVLGIESSADETAAAVVEDGRRLLSNAVASSIDLNKVYGGIVPEIAARSHVEVIIPVIEEALAQAACSWDQIDAIAVTQGPGLGGSLLIGMVSAQTLAIVKRLPLFTINHVEAHIYANFITQSSIEGYKLPAKAPSLPLLAMIVSGGHSHLILLEDHGRYEVVGQTLDDAVGEAFDKVAKMLGLPYPGGPAISKISKSGNPLAFTLPKAQPPGAYNFSFSGLKTAVLRAAQAAVGKDYTLPSSALPSLLAERQKADLAASFQQTAMETLVNTLEKAIADYQPASVVIGGGVAANQLLRQLVVGRGRGISYTDTKLCTDNAVMVASLGYYKTLKSTPTDPFTVDIDPNLKM
jgi:N6-L-threonylcarbamoyladenine synthase